MTNESSVEKITIGLADMQIRMLAPRDKEDSGSRISFWWGITSAAVVLARHIESHCEDFYGRRVIELGCGLGLTGIAAGLAGANVLFTDYVSQALEFAERNALLNGLEQGAFDTGILDWENPGPLQEFDVALGSEIVYDYFFHGSLIRLVRQILKPHGTILLADRKRLCVSRFIGRMISAGFNCEETTHKLVLGGFPDQEISIFALTMS
ncbi:MAG: methyltransferase domain-containing protein [Desulfomonile tiedjei]|uniref:Methyltransferase domain-containing protein n=1 Tax=Desulfomonile tiedjei TaxID=2358 RepID=A0A9D6V3J8_9BACT|nr:methyltransferase domain-containing protein [Desulfomonile tiedjei]